MFLASLTLEQKEAFICLAHNVVVSDGDLSVGERVMMDTMRTEMNLPDSFEAKYITLEGIEEIFDTRRSRTIAMLALIHLGYADGAFEVEEQCFIADLCRAFEISESDFGLIQNWVRRYIALEREAQSLMTSSQVR
ncbi:MAG: TerB family tellurite resistance protein [Pseudomonadales bacterium]